MTYTISFNAIGTEDHARVGGKCASLGQMTQAGVAVPPGFAVTTDAFKLVLDQHGLREEILRHLAGLDPENSDQLDRVAQAIRVRIGSHPLPDVVEQAIRDAYLKLGNFPVAVRSSATAEDMPDASFAGQQDTYLWVIGVEQVLDKVRDCWASLYTARAIAYRAKNNINHIDVLMSVGVQKMVNAKTAGVAMTLDPSNGDRIPGVGALNDWAVSHGLSPAYDKTNEIQDQQIASNVGNQVKQNFATPTAAWNTVATHPVDTLLTVSPALGLLGKGAEAANLTKTASLLGRSSELTNPVNAVTGTTKLAGKLASYPMGLLSGGSPEAIQIAAKAGAEGGAAGHGFRMNLRGHEAPDNVVNDAHQALGNLADQRRADYLANMQATGNSGATVGTGPLWKQLNDLHDSLHVKTPTMQGGNASAFSPLQKGTPEEIGKLDEMARLLAQWEAHPEGKTPIAMDAFRQRLNAMQPSFTDPNAANHRRLVTAMTNAVKDQIVKIEPSYAKAMADYENASNLKSEFEKSLSLGQKTSVDTTASKLKSAFTGNNAVRAKNLKALENYGAPNLGTRIAGQTLSPMMPKGVARYLATAITGGGWWNPSALGLLPMTSPRIVGEASHLLGRGSGLLGKVNPKNRRLARALLAAQVSQPLLGGSR